jgi:hypothetical protein
MAGLIAQQMQPGAQALPPQPTDGPGAAPAAGELDAKLSPDSIMGMLHLNPQQKQQLQRVVAAGMKVMFDQQSHQLMLDALQQPGPMPDKIGKGIAGLMGMLLNESKNSIPPELIVPAGLVLLAHAVDFLNQAGTPVSDEDFGGAVDVFVHTVMDAYGLDSDKVAAIAGDAENAAGAGADDQAQPAQEQGEE